MYAVGVGRGFGCSAVATWRRSHFSRSSGLMLKHKSGAGMSMVVSEFLDFAALADYSDILIATVFCVFAKPCFLPVPGLHECWHGLAGWVCWALLLPLLAQASVRTCGNLVKLVVEADVNGVRCFSHVQSWSYLLLPPLSECACGRLMALWTSVQHTAWLLSIYAAGSLGGRVSASAACRFCRYSIASSEVWMVQVDIVVVWRQAQSCRCCG